jgi:uncharacterized protein DUF6312
MGWPQMYPGKAVSSQERDMDDLVRRVIVIERHDHTRHASTVYEHEPKRSSRVSVLTRPLERTARRLVKADIIFRQELLRRHEESNRRRRDGWILEAPANIIEAGREAYNEARKAVPFRILPKA